MKNIYLFVLRFRKYYTYLEQGRRTHASWTIDEDGALIAAVRAVAATAPPSGFWPDVHHVFCQLVGGDSRYRSTFRSRYIGFGISSAEGDG